jgi:serine/threonine-protein kinase
MNDFLSKFEPDHAVAAVEHEVVTDETYGKRRTIRILLILLAVAVVAALAAFLYIRSLYVKLPDFTGEAQAEAETWAGDNGVPLSIESEYSLTVARGMIISTDPAAEEDGGGKIKKKDGLTVTVSKGADPSERVKLPDFTTLNLSAAEKWKEEAHADNLKIVQEYSDTVTTGAYIRMEFSGTGVTADNYTRGDYMSVFYSRGPKPTEKDITVTDFVKKSQAEAESWAKEKGIALSVTETTSDSVAAGMIISQSIPAGTKVAKGDSMEIVVSVGAAIIVPNYANYNAETAASASGKIQAHIITRYHESVPYGGLISQSIGAGTALRPDKEYDLTVVYSEGRPYLKDYRGTLEGDLPAAFYRDYTSKGASVTYSVTYVASSETKGTVVGMSDYNVFIPMTYHVVIQVSDGSLPAPTGGGIGPGGAPDGLTEE